MIIETATIILMLMNPIRTQPVVINDALTVRAEERADYLCAHKQWSHEGYQASFIGYNAGYIGENLARDFKTTKRLFRAWRKSEAHNAVLLEKRFTQIGIGKSEECNLVVLLLADRFIKNEDETATTTNKVLGTKGN